MKLKFILNEMKQVGVIYHYTSIPALLNILSTNKLIAGKVGYISFTRNKLFHKVGNTVGGMDVQIKVDGTKLSNKFKIEPYQYHFYDDPLGKSDEMEERIIKSKIENFNVYILDIKLLINSSDYQFKVDHLRGFESLILRFLPNTEYSTLLNYINSKI